MRPETARHPRVATVPRLALSPAESATAVGVSRDFFDEHILPELRVIRRGRRRLIPVRELERWLADNAAQTLEHAGTKRRSRGWINAEFRASVGGRQTGGHRTNGPAPAPGNES